MQWNGNVFAEHGEAGAGNGASTRIDVCQFVGLWVSSLNHIRLTILETDATHGIVGGLGEQETIYGCQHEVSALSLNQGNNRLPLGIELTPTVLSMRSYLQPSGFAKTVNSTIRKLLWLAPSVRCQAKANSWRLLLILLVSTPSHWFKIMDGGWLFTWES